ncbi:MAG: methylated-DNA--[protein]-cysteine S-methyltransferase [FCB group bacterium]|nr:methylated-DNA--[protein]-cysteine S-methyltransferase [FCB group bacterium]
MEKLYRHEIGSPIGKLTLLSSDKGLCRVMFPNEKASMLTWFIDRHFPKATIEAGGEFNFKAAAELEAYFAGKLTKFTVKLDLRSAGFYRQVQLEVNSIPFGKTKTYGEIARILGKPKASRAVGGGNGSNPIPIIIPCHRVLSTTGLGGFGGGLPTKKWLLEHEGVEV